jgi:hypothetical protein
VAGIHVQIGARSRAFVGQVASASCNANAVLAERLLAFALAATSSAVLRSIERRFTVWSGGVAVAETGVTFTNAPVAFAAADGVRCAARIATAGAVVERS